MSSTKHVFHIAILDVLPKCGIDLEAVFQIHSAYPVYRMQEVHSIQPEMLNAAVITA
ncbi:hypothetical protein D3C72_2135770 [compost metagenome]